MTSHAASSLSLRTSADLAEAGVARWQQTLAVRRGELERVRRGVYVDAEEWLATSPRQRVVLQARAAATSRRATPLFSHATAAILHGLPLVGPPPTDLDVLLIGATGGRSERGITAHRSRDAAEAVAPARLDDIRVTSLERTLIDVAATVALPLSLPMLDHALRLGSTTIPDLRAELRRRTSLRARSRVTRAVSLADGRAADPGESFSRARILDAGFAAPDLQRPFISGDGSRAVVDFYWDAVNLVGEFDGRVEYSRADGSGDPHALWEEKRREDGLRADGHGIVRWGWDDAWRGEPLRRLLERAGVPRATSAAPRGRSRRSAGAA